MGEEERRTHLLLIGDVARLGDGAVVVAGSAGSARLQGEHAFSFAQLLATLADGSRASLEVLSGLTEFPAIEVDQWLADLAGAGILVDVPAAPDIAADAPARFQLASLGLGAKAFERLAGATVVVVGIDAVTSAAAGYLAAYGLGHIVLASAGTDDDVAVASAIDRIGDGCSVVRRDIASRDDLASGARCDFFIGSTAAPGLIQRAYWANTMALSMQVPAVFGAARGHVGMAGPLVFPGEGPCLLCYRMRTLACADDFAEAMALEETGTLPGAAREPVLRHVADAVGGVMAFEAVKTMTAVAIPSLVGAVLELDGLEHTRRVHRILQRHDCPACRKKNRPLRRPGHDGVVGLPEARDLLVSPRCGIIRLVDPVPVDATEPARPLVLRAEIANNRFREVDHHPFQTCSGKGMDHRSALVSALGEACERYGSTAWSADQVTRKRLVDMETPVVSPADLVLFADDQYDRLPYARFEPGLEIGWFAGHDVATGGAIAVPAVEALLGYECSDAERFYSSTSNGLAAGASLEHALVGGALEVIERDAFLVAWFNHLPGVRVDPFSVADHNVRSIAEAYRRRDISLELYRLPTDVVAASVYLAIGVQTSERAVGPGPAAVVGLGADLDDPAAAAKAVLEVGQIRPALKARLVERETRERRDLLFEDPDRVEQLDDHDLLYSHAGALKWLSFWRDQDPVAWEPVGTSTLASPPERLERLTVSLGDAGHRLFGCDLTPPELASLGVFVARAVIPGFQPIHFGAKEARLGGRRLYDLPHRLGLRDAPASRADLNTLPHPIS